ncbi:Chromosome partition protein Smc [Aquisphaera giovannonii]|uniref:Chromosome partition protein Smc n=1 Tax=Aquisphaera giovannonii TaxID=406548 RepID=A0A5B9WAB2_9BACT|nr:TPM domain-containing protein [Aquisphaera giovannonii]QEH37512.1 Chromosome partition protein Smc [Aquisphaera giovannonii]
MVSDSAVIRRVLWRGAVVVAAMAAAVVARAAEKSPIPAYTGDRLYVAEVPGDFSGVRRAIEELERTSPQTYFVVVVRSAGGDAASAGRYVADLERAWREQAKAKGLKLDAARSIITLVAVDDHRVEVAAGSELRDRPGMDRAARVSLIERHFVPLAREQRYPDAIGALLAAMNNAIAANDPATARVPTGDAQLPAVAATAPPAPSAESRPATRAVAAAPAPAATPRETTGQAVMALVASLVAVGLIMAGLIWLGRRRTRNTVESKIKDYKKKAVDVMDRLDALKARLKQLPIEDPDFKEPMGGETLAFYEETQKHLTGLWDRWLEVMDVLDKAQELAKKDSALGTQKLKEAEQLVSDSKAFETIDEEAKACAASMDVLNRSHEDARADADAVAAIRKEIDGRVGEVDKEGLPTLPYRPEVEGIAGEAEKAGKILVPDPIGARRSLGAARQRAASLRDRIQRILDGFADGRKVAESLKSLGQEVGRHRKDGLRLDEDGGDPDHPIARTFEALEGLRRAVHDGDPEAAQAQLRAAHESLDEARRTLDSVLKARESCEKDLPERARETRRLREAMGQYAAFQDELKREFSPGSWQAVSGNLAQASKLLETFDAKADEAAAAATPAAQKYLLGSRLLGQLADEQRAVFRLMSGVADQLNALKAVRAESQDAARALDDLEHGTDGFFRQNDRAIGSVARGTFASAQESRKQAVGLMRDGRPDWPAARQVLARALDEFAAARNQAEADVRAYERLADELDRVRREASRVGAFLAGHEEDRLAANQHHRNAEAALRAAEAGGSNGEWVRCLELVRGAAQDLAYSERLAQEDIRLARQAEREIGEAGRMIRKSRGYFSMGVTMGTAGAEGQVGQAQQLYQSQDYEQAIRVAAAAIQQVRQAYADAAQQAYLRELAMQGARAGRVGVPAVGPQIFRAGDVPAAPGPPRAAMATESPAPDPDAGSAGASWSTGSAGAGW